jgi:hypothetical protein
MKGNDLGDALESVGEKSRLHLLTFSIVPKTHRWRTF